jgi:hypothetical protein
MFPQIIENPKLVKNPQNTWKHHKTRLAKTYTKLIILLLKLHGPNKVGLGPSCIWIKCTKASSWYSKGSPCSALAETCTTSPFNVYFNAFVLDLVMGLFGTCNTSLVFMGWSTSKKVLGVIKKNMFEHKLSKRIQ